MARAAHGAPVASRRVTFCKLTASASTSGPTTKPASELASANVDHGSLEYISRFLSIASPREPGSMFSFWSISRGF